MKILKNILELKLNIRTEMNFPVEGIEFIDVNPLLMDKGIYNEITEKFVTQIKDKNIHYIISPEARGFLFGCPVASRLDIGFIPVRKKERCHQQQLKQVLNMKKNMEKIC